jgi:hypothetical protein
MHETHPTKQRNDAQCHNLILAEELFIANIAARQSEANDDDGEYGAPPLNVGVRSQYMSHVHFVRRSYVRCRGVLGYWPGGFGVLVENRYREHEVVAC